MTLARTDAEARDLTASLTRLTEIGAPIAIADGGSPDAFVAGVRALPHVTVISPPVGTGLVGQVRASLEAASAHRPHRLLYTEPDKLDFFADHLADFLDAAATHDAADVILASRSPAGLATFPPFQRYTEGVANRLCEDLIGIAADFFYGPFLVAPDLAARLGGVPHRIGWGWRPYLFAVAQRLGRRVAVVERDFRCPDAQRHEDAAERLHRLRQLHQNIEGLLLSTARPA